MPSPASAPDESGPARIGPVVADDEVEDVEVADDRDTEAKIEEGT